MKLGFLGGGQLARMMVQEAQRMGLECHVYSSSQFDPAAQVTSHWQYGATSDLNAIVSFVEKMDLVTFESEFIPASVLLELEQKNSEKIFPKPNIMKQIQNRQSQKELLQSLKIPTAPFVQVHEAADLDLAWKNLGGPFVLKTCYGGYDGYGTFFAKQFSDMGNLAKTVTNSDGAFIAEKWIPFKRELAVILVRNSQGHCISLPLVQSQQVHGACNYVVGPIKHPSFAKMQKKLFSMLKTLDYVGAMGVEFFDTGKDLIVNELAPRVHNSGHYSQDALVENQFQLHIKAGLGHLLQPPRLLAKAFVMTNILGEYEKPIQLPKNIKGSIHLYGKVENRPRRKMGHINYVGNSVKSLLTTALKERKLFQP